MVNSREKGQEPGRWVSVCATCGHAWRWWAPAFLRDDFVWLLVRHQVTLLCPTCYQKQKAK